MDPMSLLKLLGIVIVVVGFALKLDSILIIMVAAVATALVAGMDPVTFLSTMGKSFVANRSMLIFIMTFVITGTAMLMAKFKGATAGLVVAAYGIFRVIFAAFNVGFGGVAGFVRPVIMPMAQAAVEEDGQPIAEEQLEQIKGMASGMENVTWFFGQVLFVGGSGGLLVQSTLANLGYNVELIDLAATEVPIAIIATLVTIVYYQIIDKKLMRKYHSGAAASAKAGEK